MTRTIPLALLLACGQPSPPATPAPEPGAEAPAEPPPPADEAPDEAVTGPPPGIPTSASCAPGEVTHFACPVSGGKQVALCGSEAGLQYRFGTAESLELAAPSPPSLAPFAYSREAWVRSEATAVRLSNEDVAYWLIDKSCSGAMGEGEMNNFQGVAVRQGDKELARLGCTAELEGSLGALEGKLASIGYLE